MKKVLLFIFALFYFSVTSGAVVEFHYCMGKLVEWGIGDSKEEQTCSNCKMNSLDSKNCCKKELKEVKVEKAQKAEFSFQFKQFPSFVAQSFVFEPVTAAPLPVRISTHYSNAPPRAEKTPVFVTLQTFRI